MPGFDNLGMAPEIIVDLEAEFADTSVDPTSDERESDTDVLRPLAMAVLGWMLLWKRSPGCCRRSFWHSHQHLKASERRASPKLWVSPDRETPTGSPAPLHSLTPPWPLPGLLCWW